MHRINFDKYNVIIFDCDGVIFDTNQVKIEAMYAITSFYNKDAAKLFSNYFACNFGKTRAYFIKKFITDFCNEPFSQSLFDTLLTKYSEKCFALYKNANFTDDVLTVLKTFYNKKKMFVASGSDQEELKKVFKYRKVDYFFSDIFGSPIKKIDHLKLIYEEHQGPVLFIGDAKEDFLCANEHNIDFLLINKYSSASASDLDYIKSKCMYSIDSFKDLVF